MNSSEGNPSKKEIRSRMGLFVFVAKPNRVRERKSRSRGSVRNQYKLQRETSEFRHSSSENV